MPDRTTPHRSAMERPDNVLPQPTVEPDVPTGREIVLFFFWASIVCGVLGIALVTVGTGMQFGIPSALIILGTLLIGTSVLLGLSG